MPIAEELTTDASLNELLAHSRVFNASSDLWVVQDNEERASELAKSHPEIVRTFVVGQADCLAGSTSFNLDSTLRHGLVPSSLIKELGITVLGLEHESDPDARNGVHVVPWTQAGETIRYAEWRVHPRRTYDYVTPSNAAELAALDPSPYEAGAGAIGTRMLGLIQEARLFVANRNPDADESGPFYPVVYGLNSSKISASIPIKLVESAIRNDTAIDGRVPAEAISVIFAPNDHAHKLEQQLSHERPDIHVSSLEALRTLDTAMYGWMLPKPRTSQ